MSTLHDQSHAAVDSTTTAPAQLTAVRTPFSHCFRPTTANHPSSSPTSILDVERNPADRYWKFTFGAYILLPFSGLVGVGCIGYLLSTLSLWPTSSYNPVGPWDLWPSLLTFSLSILWCSVCLFLWYKSRHTFHPGLYLSVHLVLWLGFVFTTLFALLASRMMMRFGHDAQIVEYVSMQGYTSSDYGNYLLVENGTWVWTRDMRFSEATLHLPRTCQGSGYPELPPADDMHYAAALAANAAACAEQDEGVNELWRAKPMRVGFSLAALVCQCIGLVGHFLLFVRACVDTKRYRRVSAARRIEELAGDRLRETSPFKVKG
ncbi:hypothetical protein LEMA_P078010.1 [Plenodomus lingam JN3]|uniref:Uncharacterized protein n=1 Tax=Leptosphaeria maculans (strain JN3 / isolate v23.1.3 / race Av1-4-5-6-7-8) TaxID=985895 RepID=E5A4L4_LEPMJ|nr:hypothetical protein LEMA_P078010.1 [Plenodomus lingam JN3]CBX98562.1 hypothetical protein LEMA_P078010.1 [Plenodomus lingam JN3]